MEKLKLKITSNGMDGEGIARYESKVCFVDGAVEGDEVEVSVIKDNKNYTKAKVEKIIEKSQFRCNAPCNYFGECGGCSMQHIMYEQQLKIKQNNIKSLLQKSKLDVSVNECKPSIDIFGYRNKLTLFVNQKNELCFNKKGSNNLVNINDCLLVNDKFNNLIKIINNYLKTNLYINNKVLKSLVIRQVDDVFIINLVMTKKIVFDNLINILKLNKIKFSLYYCINTKNNLQISPSIFIAGESKVFTIENNIKYQVHPLSFMQVNNSMKQQIYNDIIDIVGQNNVVIDAFSGMGVLSSYLAKKSFMVYAIEREKSSTDACIELCKINKIKNLQTINDDCTCAIPKLLKNTSVDVIVLDPARSGVTEEVLNAIINSNIKKVVYLSCNPATLVRDLKVLDTNGYKIDYLQPYDMFPQTSEVETLVCLSLK